MGKITRQSEASHVTTRTFAPDAPGDSPIVDLSTYNSGPAGEDDGQTANENTAPEVQFDDPDDVPPTDGELDELGVDPNGEITDEHKDMIRAKREERTRLDQHYRPAGPETVEHDHTDPSQQLTESQVAEFNATGEAEVKRAEEPPVDGTIENVKTWVGDDYVRAERALDAERRNKNRSGLVSWLEKVAESK